MTIEQSPGLGEEPIRVELKDGTIVQLNSIDHRENPNGNGLLMEVDYDIIKLGSLPEDQVFDAMWAEVGPTVIQVLSRDPDVESGVEARLKARREGGELEPADQVAAPHRRAPRSR